MLQGKMAHGPLACRSQCRQSILCTGSVWICTYLNSLELLRREIVMVP